MTPATSTAWFCLTAAVLSLAAASAFGALAITLSRRVASLADDLAALSAERGACPDRDRIAHLEDFARAGQAPRGRHGPRPRAGLPGPWTPPPPDPMFAPEREQTRLLAAPTTAWPPR